MARARKNVTKCYNCPVGSFFSSMEKLEARNREISKHLRTAAYEILQAIKAVAEVGLSTLETKKGQAGSKASKIEVL